MSVPFSPAYEAQLREHFAGDYANNYLIGALRTALDPKTFNGVEMARGIMAIYDDVNALRERREGGGR